MKVDKTVSPVDELISTSFDSDRLSHAYIVGGDLVETLTMAAICSGSPGDRPCMKCPHCHKASRRTHPDVILIERNPDKREIFVDQIRGLRTDAIVVPNDAEKKVYVIDSADLMNRNAQNALLQILEEPPSHAVFILKTENPDALLWTVRSRCVEIKARVRDSILEPIAEELAKEFFSVIGHGNAALAAFAFRLEKLDKDVFAEFLPAARKQASERLRAAVPGDSIEHLKKISSIEHLLVKAGEMLDLNVSTGHISGMIFANLLQIEN